MGVKIIGHQALVVILSSIREECQLLKKTEQSIKIDPGLSPIDYLAETWTGGSASRRQP